MNTHIDIEIKKSIWIALSDLFLDTELTEQDLDHIAKVIKDTGIPLESVEGILIDEVLPVCIPNMKIVTGNWTGFDEEWLIESILNLKKPGIVKRAIYKNDFKLIKDDWLRILEKLKGK